MIMKKGYCAIGIYRPKNSDNMGTLWRSAHLLNADFIFTIGYRYKYQPTDTLKSTRHIPLFHYEDWNDFEKSKPEGGQIVCIEQGGKPLKESNHPKQAIYVLGSEDTGIPQEYLKNNQVIEIESTGYSSFNVATAGTIVLYDRLTRLNE